MADEPVRSSVCHTLRTEIYQMIFPRWALMIAGGLIVSALVAVFGFTTAANDKAVDSLNDTKLLEQKFTMTVEHIRENQAEIKSELKEQRVLLQKIERQLDGNR